MGCASSSRVPVARAASTRLSQVTRSPVGERASSEGSWTVTRSRPASLESYMARSANAMRSPTAPPPRIATMPTEMVR